MKSTVATILLALVYGSLSVLLFRYTGVSETRVATSNQEYAYLETFELPFPTTR